MAPAVEVDGVSKHFKLQREKVRTLKEKVVLFRRDRSYEEFWALKDVSFDIDQGTTFGLIGANGSGKSTLLKILSGILRPTSGEVRIRGRLGALLELGAGFHPDLTGRENVYLNASILGFSKKQIDARFDSIVEFAELETFIDNQVRHYSSGMYVRLGFAVAVHMDPEVLLVDEVLAVGDESFQDKCLERIRRFQQEGRTIVVVTHAVDVVRQMCHRAALLDHGVLAELGEPGAVVRAYREKMSALETSEDARFNSLGTANVVSVRLLDVQHVELDVVPTGSSVVVEAKIEVKESIEDPIFDLNIYDNSGVHIFGTNTHWRWMRADLVPGEATLSIELPFIPMRQGRYVLVVGVHSRDGKSALYGRSSRLHFVVEPRDDEPGTLNMQASFVIEGTAVKGGRVAAS